MNEEDILCTSGMYFQVQVDGSGVQISFDNLVNAQLTFGDKTLTRAK